MPSFQPISAGPIGSFPNLPPIGGGDYFPPRYFPRRYFAWGSPPPPPPPGQYWAPRYFPPRYWGGHVPAVITPPSPGVPGKYWPPRYFPVRYFPWYGPLQIPPIGKGLYWAPKYFSLRYWGQNQPNSQVITGPGPYWARRYFAPRYWGYFFPGGKPSLSTPALWTFRARTFAAWTFRSWYSVGPPIGPPGPGKVDGTFDDLKRGRGLIFDEAKRANVFDDESLPRAIVYSPGMAETLVKRSGELRTYAWEFGSLPELTGGDTLVAPVSLIPDQTGLTLGQPFIQGTQVRCAVSSGVDGTQYKLIAASQTAGGSKLEVIGYLAVRDD